MADKKLEDGHVQFQTEGRLLQELGERLVASPQVALVELVKNSFDADATTCEIRVEPKGTALTLSDNGLGMTLDDFEQRWMRIATGAKTDQRVSRQFGRRVTGQKGIGRFAVRFLGRMLTLDSVASDKKRGVKTRLSATFDWPRIDREHNLRRLRPFTIYRRSTIKRPLASR